MFVENAVIHHATKAKAERLSDLLAAEYPVLSLRPIYEADGIKVTGFESVYTEQVERTGDDQPDDVETVVLSTKKVPELADIFAACEDLDLDPEAIEPEEERASGSVVDVIYRRQYKEASTTGQSCGDWLAEWLVRALDAEGKLDEWCFTGILSNNGVDLTAKWAQVATGRSPGWKGRYRMNGRQALDKRVALTGKLFDEAGQEHEVPADFLATLRSKHAKWIAKMEKQAQREQEAADALAAE